MPPASSFRRLWSLLPKTSTAPFCPTEIQETIPIDASASIWRRFRRYAGVGFLVAVGYMDPGNWATDIEAGSRFGYGLLCVVLLSSLIAMLLQSLCVRLGLASGRDLAELSREHFPPRVNFLLWVFAEIAIIACDFAEVLGTALALKLLFGLPLSAGVLLTAFDTLLILMLQGKRLFRVEMLVMILIGVISAAFFAEIFLSKPEWGEALRGLWPDLGIFSQPESWMIAIGILGATVMPHNLYLHSSAVGTRKLIPGHAAKKDAIRLMTYDTLITLGLAFFVNAAILILAASAFHATGHVEVREIDEAYYLLAPLLGTGLASILFGLALFAAGQSSTLTGTMAGQVVLQGFLNLSIPCWQQRLITRLVAILPAWIGVIMLGEGALGKMLVASQVVLSMQLPFAIVPLILFCGSEKIMGAFVVGRPLRAFCWVICAGIVSANLYLLFQL